LAGSGKSAIHAKVGAILVAGIAFFSVTLCSMPSPEKRADVGVAMTTSVFEDQIPSRLNKLGKFMLRMHL
jgi:hypothetical protein